MERPDLDRIADRMELDREIFIFFEAEGRGVELGDADVGMENSDLRMELEVAACESTESKVLTAAGGGACSE